MLNKTRKTEKRDFENDVHSIQFMHNIIRKSMVIRVHSVNHVVGHRVVRQDYMWKQ